MVIVLYRRGPLHPAWRPPLRYSLHYGRCGLRPKSDDRGNTGRAAAGHETGPPRNGSEARGHGGKCQRIDGPGRHFARSWPMGFT